MPRLESVAPNLSGKSLLRKASQSASVFGFAKAGFYRAALPKVRRAMSLADRRIRAMHKLDPVPDDTICRMNASLIALVECERSLLGFPLPGRRKDESGVLDGRKPTIDVTPPAYLAPNGQEGGQAGQDVAPSQDLSALDVDSASNG